MVSIGIEQGSTLIYEGSPMWGRAMAPSPVVSAAAVISSSDDIVSFRQTTDLLTIPLIFLEDAFDAVTKIRRGRFYEKNSTQPLDWVVYSHPSIASERKHGQYVGGVSKRLATFYPCSITSSFFSRVQGQPLVIIGSGDRFTIWTVVSTELTVTKEEIVLLRQRSTFGALPEMAWANVPESGVEKIAKTINILGADIFTSGPESVIDRARDAASAIISAYLVDANLASGAEDLGRLVSILGGQRRSDRPNICMNGGDILAILHPRAKPSEQAKRPLRPVREQDAELAVQLVGTMLCDLGWANWR